MDSKTQSAISQGAALKHVETAQDKSAPAIEKDTKVKKVCHHHQLTQNVIFIHSHTHMPHDIFLIFLNLILFPPFLLLSLNEA